MEPSIEKQNHQEKFKEYLNSNEYLLDRDRLPDRHRNNLDSDLIRNYFWNMFVNRILLRDKTYEDLLYKNKHNDGTDINKETITEQLAKRASINHVGYCGEMQAIITTILKLVNIENADKTYIYTCTGKNHTFIVISDIVPFSPSDFCKGCSYIVDPWLDFVGKITEKRELNKDWYYKQKENKVHEYYKFLEITQRAEISKLTMSERHSNVDKKKNMKIFLIATLLILNKVTA